MKLATLFSIPKAFIGHSSLIQTNAVGSWERLKPEFEVLLCGQDDGVASLAHERGLEHIPELRKSEGGVPLLRDAFKAAHARQSHYKIYVNADIIFLSDLSRMLSSIGELELKDFLIIGQRIDLNVIEPINFESSDWEVSLREQVARDGRRAPVVCKDYFIFPASLYN